MQTQPPNPPLTTSQIANWKIVREIMERSRERCTTISVPAARQSSARIPFRAYCPSSGAGMQTCLPLVVERRTSVDSSRAPFCLGHSESYPCSQPNCGQTGLSRVLMLQPWGFRDEPQGCDPVSRETKEQAKAYFLP